MRDLMTSIWYVLTLRCEEADRIRSMARREDMTRAERTGAWAHALVCRSCWAARKQADKLEALVHDLRENQPSVATSGRGSLSEERRARLARALENEAERLEK